MKVILVDDERLARKRLAELLQAHAYIVLLRQACVGPKYPFGA